MPDKALINPGPETTKQTAGLWKQSIRITRNKLELKLWCFCLLSGQIANGRSSIASRLFASHGDVLEAVLLGFERHLNHRNTRHAEHILDALLFERARQQARSAQLVILMMIVRMMIDHRVVSMIRVLVMMIVMCQIELARCKTSSRNKRPIIFFNKNLFTCFYSST